MKFAAQLTAGGIIGLIILEALKIILAPVGVWLLAVIMLALKIMLAVVAVGAAIGVGVFFYRRTRKAAAEDIEAE